MLSGKTIGKGGKAHLSRGARKRRKKVGLKIARGDIGGDIHQSQYELYTGS